MAYIGISTGIKDTIKIRNKYDRKIRIPDFCIYFVSFSYLFCIFKDFVLFSYFGFVFFPYLFRIFNYLAVSGIRPEWNMLMLYTN